MNRIALTVTVLSLATATALAAAGFVPGDLAQSRSVTDVKISPDSKRVAYTITKNDGPGRPYGQLQVYTIATDTTVAFSTGTEKSGGPEWSPDGTKIAYRGKLGTKSGLIVANADSSDPTFIIEVSSTNSPLPSTGKSVTWSPDSKQLAFVNAVPGPETSGASGDPVVITRYLYKPNLEEGGTRFNDNKRLHIFIADLASGMVRQATTGNHYEHSIEWSPHGEEIVFVSNREPNEDQFFNYDLFTLNVADGSVRRLTATENIEYRPHWSPDGRTIIYQGCKRGLTDLETTMEDTHVWAIDADGRNRRELGKAIDNRQGEALWNAEGDAVYFTVQDRGNVSLYSCALATGRASAIVAERGGVGAASAGRDGLLAYTFTSPSDVHELYLRINGETRPITHLNTALLAGKEIAPVESFAFVSNDNKWEVEAFLTRPQGMTATSRHPLIVVIHGGPHSQQGPAFNFKNQVYSARGWATLMVNYRGSTGYGQAFADGVYGDQNGNEAQDVLYAVSAAMRRNLWIDRERIGVEGVSYGGQLSAWLTTQTRLFKSSIPTAAIINLVSYNYTTYYNQYEQMTFGIFPHQGNLMDLLWERSALKHVGKVATPTLLIHGENDNDVPIGEAEQFFIALKDVGVETKFVRYPREGHGVRETRHVIDWTERSIRWHDEHFPKAN